MKMMESREDAIDFPCSEGYATHYASLGLTRDFPPEFYRNLPELRGDKLERELDEMEADHIKPWHEGGQTTAKNCQMLCKDHNRRKAGK